MASTRRLAHMTAHLASASPVTTAGIFKWITDIFSGGDDHAPVLLESDAVAVVSHVDFPAQNVDGGHVHPDIVQTADGTLVVVYAAMENPSGGKDVLMCTRSTDLGRSWSNPTPILCSRFTARPKDHIPEAGHHEVYPGTLTMLAGDRILCTWDYYQAGNVAQGRALMYTISADGGISWSDNQLIFDPDSPPDPNIDVNQHLGTLRHSILPLEDGRWLLPLTQENDLGPHKYPGVKIYDPQTGTLEADCSLSPGEDRAPSMLEHPVLMVVQATTGARLAMGKGNSGHNQNPPELPSAAPVLYSASGSGAWEEVDGFPANVECPDGVALDAWDDDGDRWGRHVIALADGRMLVVWVVAGDRSEPSQGMHFCISDDDGKTWDVSKTVTILPDTMIVGRYYQPKTVQLHDGDIGTIFCKGPQGKMDGVFFLRVPLNFIEHATSSKTTSS